MFKFMAKIGKTKGMRNQLGGTQDVRFRIGKVGYWHKEQLHGTEVYGGHVTTILP